MTHYIFLGGPENLKYWIYQTERERSAQWFWSANKHVRPGDIGYIYLSAPLSRIVGEVDILAEPFFHHSQTMFDNPHMADKWCVEVGNPRYYGNRDDLSMKNLRKLFAVDWGWVRYPRGNTRVPDEILPALKELIGEKSAAN
jgi:hypothetical protein